MTALIADFERGELKKRYNLPSLGPAAIRPYRYDLVDFKTNKIRLPGIEASRGCPFTCNFCVLTGHERYRYRPVGMEPTEVIEHFKRLCNQLGSLTNVARHFRTKLWQSSMPRYKSVILASGPEILSVRNPIRNERRRYIAGQDPIEDWDARMMRELGLTPQSLSPSVAESSASFASIGRKVA